MQTAELQWRSDGHTQPLHITAIRTIQRYHAWNAVIGTERSHQAAGREIRRPCHQAL